MNRSRLAPGAGIVTVPGGRPVLRTSEGEFLRIDTGRVGAEELVGRLAPREGAYAESAELDHLVTAFEEAGHAVTEPRRLPLTGRTVHLLGDPVLTEPLSRFAAAEGAEVRPATADDVAALTGERDTAVLWCLDSPVPEGLWDEADRLPARHTAWLRCHREGAQAWIEPLASAPGDVTAAHVRLRRLAATAAHRELAAYWAGHRTPDTGPHPTQASAALIAALLTADLIAWAKGEPPRGARLPARRRLRQVDLRHLTVTEHPVLPVPEVAPLPAPTARTAS
ncbi:MULTISPECIES: hypothetical protein [unclassified Streptomyces]|uniref:hypothetical protein n=1 Tax=unclassified Streptomyces TaxID=2593676 RepID=UPI00081DF207|nr:hypothetical protein [Streptomyces sp. ScaeMP-e83]MYR96160.1 hypothetical protein [Streptomyces sp. SID4937]SCE04296.1 hypothetical protein GA0115243_10606 [Streptomyces sp. ScaeMP-e83]